MGNCRAFLWQDNVMSDLNALIPANSPLYLMFACAINDLGEIAGQAFETSTGEVHAFLATPIPGKAGNESFSPEARSAASPMILPEAVREQLRQRLPFGRFGGRPTAPAPAPQ